MRNIICCMALSVSSIPLLAAAITCPSPAAIHQQNWQGWRAYSENDGIPLTEKQLLAFSHEVARFTLAEWRVGTPEGASLCYYRNRQGSLTEAYLAQHNLQPQGPYWRIIAGDDKNCQADISACLFEPVNN